MGLEDNRPKRNKQDRNNNWPVKAFFLAFGLAVVFSFFSETTLMGVSVWVAVALLCLIILIGILSDLLGVSVTIEDVTAYSAMASKKIRGAKEAIRLIKNADRVSNICNDIIGDICSIISGAMGVAIIARLFSAATERRQMIMNILLSALISGIMVFGKAIGKRIALEKSHEIVFFAAKFLSLFNGKER